VFRSVYAGVTSRPLLVVLAAVFAGLAMVLVIAAFVSGQPLVLMAAVPLAMTAGLMWYQGTGRLSAGLFGTGSNDRWQQHRYRHQRSDPRTTDGGASEAGGGHDESGATAGGSGPGTDGDTWERPFDEEAHQERRYRARRQARRTAGDERASTSRGAWDSYRSPDERPDRLGGLTRAEAYEVLGLDPTASEESVREAYRQRAKTVHPDTDDGSAEAFQKLNDAYERILGE
jgi:hypothetical protein